MNKILGNHIKSLRNAKNLTQEQVASSINISRQKYVRIEKGENSITLELLQQLSKVFNVSVSDITHVLDKSPEVYYRIGSNQSSTSKIFEMLDLFYANKHLYEKIQASEQGE